MSPRRNRPPRSGRADRGRRGAARPDRAEPLDVTRARRGVTAVEAWRGRPWQVWHIPGEAATKTYRCPGCDHEIRPGTPHVVVWPAAGVGEVAERRHWHTGCWRQRDRR